MKCEGGECVVAYCKDGYHKIEPLPGCDPLSSECSPRCSENSPTACGADHFDCLSILVGATKADCIGPFQCKATNCMTGYHLYDAGGICEADTILNCGEHGLKCEDSQYCMPGSPKAQCALSCTGNYQQCDADCVDTRNNVAHCGNCQTDCRNLHKNAIVECTDRQCVIRACDLNYHLDNDINECVPDSVNECGKYHIDCTDQGHQIANATMSCKNAECSYQCNTGYADCDSTLMNGCETELEKYGLALDSNGQCVCQSNLYQRCGTFTENNVERPLCLKQGKYYKNYIKRSDLPSNSRNCNNNAYEYLYIGSHTTSNLYCYDRCLSRNCESSAAASMLTVQYDKQHNYSLIDNSWKQDVYEWNEAHCINACNTANGFKFESNGNKESLGHLCRPTQECDMFDSVEPVDRNYNGKFYIDYGCAY